MSKCSNLVISAAGDSGHSSQGRRHARGSNFFTFLFIRTWTSRASPRTLIVKNRRVRKCCRVIRRGVHIFFNGKTILYFLTHTRTNTHRYACYQDESQTHGRTDSKFIIIFVYKIWMGKLGWNSCLFSKKLKRALTLTSWLSTRNGLMSKAICQMRSWVCINWMHPLKTLCRWAYVYNLESTVVFEVYIKRIPSNHFPCPPLPHTIFTCVSVSQYMFSTYECISTL